MKMLSVAVVLAAVAASAAVPLKNGTRFAMKDVPEELVVERRAGEPVRFALEENGTTGYLWAAEWNTNECEVVLDHRGPGGDQRVCGAAGTLDVAVTSKIYTPARIEFAYKRPWEKGVALEIQAESPYPRPKFLKLAKEMGAKFSFGTNNFDPTPKDLSRWLEAITWLDLKPTDIWSPGERWRMSASAMDLYGEMLAHSSGESLDYDIFAIP